MTEIKILAISDTHGHIEDIDFLMNNIGDVDYIIHAGDHIDDAEYIEKNYHTKVIGVGGNCDFNPSAPGEIVEEIGGKVFFITHGHDYNIKYDLNRIFYRGKELGADIIVFGHSHIPYYSPIDKMILLNPGSLSLPRGNSSQSYALITIYNEEVNIEIKELS